MRNIAQEIHDDEQAKICLSTGIHEASHFVALMSRGYYCEEIIVHELGGRVSGLSYPKERSLAAQLIDETILCMAGQAGEEIHAGKTLAITGSASDYKFVIEKWKILGYTECEALAIAQRQKQVVKSLLIENWSKVQRIAKKLQQVKQLTFNQAAYL